MPGLFIDISIDPTLAGDAAAAKKLEEVCPVDIFKASDTGVELVESNLDECTLCDLCVQAFPGKVAIKKLYEE